MYVCMYVHMYVTHMHTIYNIVHSFKVGGFGALQAAVEVCFAREQFRVAAWFGVGLAVGNRKAKLIDLRETMYPHA